MADPYLSSQGSRPDILLDDFFPGGIFALMCADAVRELVIVSPSGKLTRMDWGGELLLESTGIGPIRFPTVSADGKFLAGANDERELILMDDRFHVRWKARLSSDINAVALSPYGSHAAASTEASRTEVVTADRERWAVYESLRPLNHVQFLMDTPELVGAGDFGYLCRFNIDGEEIWTSKIANGIGDCSTSACGRRIALAGFAHGVQIYSGRGSHKGSLMLDGHPARVSVSANRSRIGVLTTEASVYWLDADGDLRWAGDFSQDPPVAICAGPLGERLFVACGSGRLVHLEW